MGRQRSQRQGSAGRGACVWREPGASHAPPPGRFSHKDQETPDALWQEDKAQRHRFVHASACHHDESRRSTSAIVWYCGTREYQRKCYQTTQRHPLRCRNRHFPECCIPQASHVFRQPLLQPRGSRRSSRYFGSPAGPFGHLHGKNGSHQIKNQICFDVSHFRDHRCLCGGYDHHDFCNSCIQGSFFIVWSRFACPNTFRDGY